MAVKTDFVAEREGLKKRIAELQKLCIDEWIIMSHQVAVARNKELLEAMARVRALDLTIARAKLRTGRRDAK